MDVVASSDFFSTAFQALALLVATVVVPDLTEPFAFFNAGELRAILSVEMVDELISVSLGPLITRVCFQLVLVSCHCVFVYF